MQKKKDTLEKKKCYTYMVRCSDHSLYTGWTNDLEQRIAAHNSGQGANTQKADALSPSYTMKSSRRNRTPCAREYAIKQLTKKEKEKLVAYHHLSSIAT